MTTILTINVGSSSIKYSLFNDLTKLESGYEERLHGLEDYKKAVDKILKNFSSQKIDLVVHRVVHGGKIKETSRINSNIKKQIKKFSTFAPLHNPKQLKVIEILEKKLKNIPQYSAFDTAFYSSLPQVAKIYPIPKNVSKKYSIEKYGFHGLSHKSVSRELKGKTITVHLGSGCSITAIKDSKPIDTTMGLTPLEGLMMTTRSGTIDPGLVLFIAQKYSVKKAKEILSKESGFKGVSGYKDFRDILKTMKKKKDSKLTYDLFIYQITKIIGSYAAALNGLDNLVFTAAIGENVSKLRKEVCNSLKFLGIKLDEKKNKANKELISSRDSKIKVYVKKSDEELEMVKEVLGR